MNFARLALGTLGFAVAWAGCGGRVATVVGEGGAAGNDAGMDAHAAGGSGGTAAKGGAGGATTSKGGAGGAGGGSTCPGLPSVPKELLMVPDAVDGTYKLTAVGLAGAPCGAYTFVSAGDAGIQYRTVSLQLNGSEVTSVVYWWGDTVGAGKDSTIDFPGYFSIGLTYAKGGTANLYYLPDGFFDGKHVLLVP